MVQLISIQHISGDLTHLHSLGFIYVSAHRTPESNDQSANLDTSQTHELLIIKTEKIIASSNGEFIFQNFLYIVFGLSSLCLVDNDQMFF